MKSFRQLTEEKKKSLVMAICRMNPPTKGHEENINNIQKHAQNNDADHVIIASHTHDARRNPLDVNTKMKHLNRAFPEANIIPATKEAPGILHHAVAAHKRGYSHVIVAAGEGAESNYHLLKTYNGVEARHGYYKFDHIEHKSTGERKAGISGTDMREHVKKGNFNKFKDNLPSRIASNPQHSTELFHDVTKGMGLHESVNHGHHKAIFVTGGPGSGKDIIIRDCIAEQNVLEFNFTQVLDILNDKHALAKRSMNPRMESVRNRMPLIINGPADDSTKIAQIKEELEELGYQTMMIFVDTSDLASKERNSLLSRMMVESIRHERWTKAQDNREVFGTMFESFVRFDNTGDLENKVDDISETFKITTQFLSEPETNSNRFLSLYESSLGGAKSIQKSNLSQKGLKVLQDNNSPAMQMQAKKGKIDDVRDGDIKSNGGYSKIGGQSFAYESTQPKLIKMAEPKETRFSMDANKTLRKKLGDKSPSTSRATTPDGVGSTYDSRATTGAAGAGLGDQSYREEVEFSNNDVTNFGAKTKGVNPNPLSEKKRLKKFKESIFDFGSGDSGVGGTLGGSSNKEPLVTPLDKYGQSGITIKKKKVGAK